MSARREHPPALVDINRVAELAGLDANGGVTAGAVVRADRVARDAAVRAALPVLADAAARVGHPAVRNRGTVGGNLAFADPANNLPVVAVALDAELTVRSTERRAHDRRRGLLPRPRTRRRSSPASCCARCASPACRRARAARTTRSRRARAAGAWPARRPRVWLAEDGTIAGARVALGGVGETPVRVDADGADRRRRAGAEAFAAAGGGRPRGGRGAARGPARLRGVPPPPGRRRRRASAAGRERPRGREGVMDADVRAIELTVNGRERHVAVEPRRLLSDCLREDLGLTGTNLGCEQGVCGACTVLVDGATVRSCLMFAVQADGADGHTVEGLADGGDAAPAAGGVLGAPGPAVRLLHAGDADDRARAARAQPAARRAGDPRGAVGQPVPLHGLPAHRRRRSRPRRGRSAAMAVDETRHHRSWIGARPQAPRGPGAADRSATYVNDFALPGHAARGGAAQPARRTPGSSSIDTARGARRSPGVVAVLTGAELAEVHRPAAALLRRGGRRARDRRRQGALRRRGGRGRGRPRRRYMAEDALALVEVEYELLPPVVDAVEAPMAGRRRSCTRTSDSTSSTSRRSRFGDVEGDFAARRRTWSAARCAGRG